MEIGMSSQRCEPTVGSGRDVMPSIEDRLLIRKQNLERDLQDVNNALEALQANPEVLKIMCLISKVNY